MGTELDMNTERFNVHGMEFLSIVEDNDHAARKNGRYEHKAVQWLTQFSESIDLFIDVGAFCGWYSLHMYDSGVEVAAFEPSPIAHFILKQNFNNNESEVDYSVGKVAVSDETTELEAGIGDCGFIEIESGIGKGRGKKVPTVKLDEIFGLESGIQCTSGIEEKCVSMKVDVEGHENKALQGAKELLGYVEFLIVEYHPWMVQESEIAEAHELLVKAGFCKIDDKSPFKSNPTIRYRKRW